MPTPSKPANQRQRTWRAQAVQPEQRARRRRVFRVLLPLLGICLLAALVTVFAMWLLRPPKLELIAIAVGDYRNPEVPPIAYCYEDLEALRKAVAPDDADRSSWNDARTDKITQLDAALAASSNSHDNVLVYIKAHGVSLNESPYLLDASFELRGRSGRLPVGKLLDDVAESPARIKLLVLDTGHLQSDPRMGMLANEFTLLVEKLVAAMPAEKNVWVLTSNSLFEQAQVSLKDRRSAFNYYLAEGLKGSADGALASSERDGLVQLDELYAYVRGQVIQYARVTSSDQQSQTPVLLHSGEGEVTAPPHEDLLRIEKSEEEDGGDGGDEKAVVAHRGPRRRAANSARRIRPGPLAMVLVRNQAAAPEQPAPVAGSTTAVGAASQAPVTHAPSAPAKDDGKQAAAAAASAAPNGSAATKEGAAVADKTAIDKAAAEPSVKPETAGGNAKKSSAELSKKPTPRRRSPVDQRLFDAGGWLEAQQQREELWRPTDYAPVLARLYYESLRGCRQRASAGELFLKVPAYQSSLANKLSEVERLQRQIDEQSAAFVRGLARPSYERDDDARAAIRLRNDALFLLPLLIEHQAITSANVPSRMQGELQGLIVATRALDRQLMREPGPRDSTSALDQWKQALAATAQQVRNHLGTIENEFQARYEEQRRLAGAPGNPTVAPRLADLARSPLATAQNREELQTMAQQAARSFAEVEKQGSTQQRQPSATERQRLSGLGWQRVIDRAELELQLAAVLQDGASPAFEEIRKTLATSGGLTNVEAQLALVRKIDHQLSQTYGNLPNEIRDQLKTSQYHAWRLAETAIRLADARDQKRIEAILQDRSAGPWADPVTGVPLKAIPEQIARYQLTLGNGAHGPSNPIPLNFSVPQKLSIRFASNEILPPERLRLRLDYNAERVQIKNGQGTELPPGRIWPAGQAASAAAREHQVDLEIASLDQSGQQTSLSVVWLDESDRELARDTAALLHPEPKFSQLAVYGQPGTADYAWERNGTTESYFAAPFEQGIAHVRLTPFAGHATRYDFRLTNPATHPKKYQAVVFALPPPDDPSKARDLQSLVLAGTTRGAKLAENVLDVPPGATVSIPFFPPEPAPAAGKEPPAAADAAKGGGAKSAESAAKPPAPDITSGLVCVLTEKAASTAGAAALTGTVTAESQQQIIVVELETQHPSNFLTPRVDYNARDGRITAQISVPNPDRLPPDGARVEIDVVTEEQVRQGPDAVRAAQVTRQDPEQTLRVYAPTGTPARAEVFLHVDGYPRAFIYDLPLDASLPNVERTLLDLRRIALPDPATWRVYYPGRVDELVRFPFSVDMPPSQDRSYFARLFIDRQPGGDFSPADRVLVESPRDRVHQMTLAKPESGPGLAIQTQVSDFVAMLDLRPYLNEVHVRAQLVRREQDREQVLGDSGDRADKEIVLYLDGEAPTLTVRGPNRAVEVNEAIRIDVFPRDQVTGIDKLEFAQKTLPKPDSKDPEDRILAEPKPVPQLRSGAYQLPYAFEAPGEQVLWFQATDKSGNKSELGKLTIVVRKPAAANSGGQPAVAQYGQIFGRATSPAGTGGRIDKVVLSDAQGVVDEQSKPPNGEFRFEKVKPGEYTLQAEGTVSGNFGKPVPKKVTVEAGKSVGPITVLLGR